jgi:predicted hydrocarbon binding protein
MIRARREKLEGQATVKATMLHAHVEYAGSLLRDAAGALRPHLDARTFALVAPGVLATTWVPLRDLVAVDRAIAAAVGGVPEHLYRKLGRHSAVSNLAGAYKTFAAEEPHRFFENMARLHARFQNFGRSVYARTDERAGCVRLEDYYDYSPVFCASAIGYYEGALETMHVPGPIRVFETECTCAGDPACVFDLTW